MKKAAMPSETLAGMYNTDVPFLESNKVPVIKRKFNFIPTGGKGDPPRALTDQPPLKTHFYEQHTVMSDFPKTMAYRMYGDGFKQFPDGTYNDAIMDIDQDYENRQKTLKQIFAPSDVYQFMRADREQYSEEMMKDYFRSKYEEREEAEEMFLQNYGLVPHEIKTVMAQRRVEAAAKALELAKTSNKIATYRPNMTLRREDLIADRFMNNTMPLFSADDTRGAGNAQPLAKGHENWTRGFDETSPYARKTPGAITREQRSESSKAFIAAGKERMNAVMGMDDAKTVMGGAGRESVSMMTTDPVVGDGRRPLYTKDSIIRKIGQKDFDKFNAEFQPLLPTTPGNATVKNITKLRGEIIQRYGLTKVMVTDAYGLNKANVK